MMDVFENVLLADFRPPPEALFVGGVHVDSSPSPGPSGAADASAVTSGTVPSVIGRSFGDATFELRNAGYDTDSNRGCDPSGNADLHEVYSQSPPGGTDAPAGTTVTIYYEAGGCG